MGCWQVFSSAVFRQQWQGIHSAMYTKFYSSPVRLALKQDRVERVGRRTTSIRNKIAIQRSLLDTWSGSEQRGNSHRAGEREGQRRSVASHWPPPSVVTEPERRPLRCVAAVTDDGVRCELFRAPWDNCSLPAPGVGHTGTRLFTRVILVEAPSLLSSQCPHPGTGPRRTAEPWRRCGRSVPS